MNRTIDIYFANSKTCNLDCKYCYLPNYQKTNKKHTDADILHSLQLLIHKIEEESYKIGQFCFHGAEPAMISAKALANCVMFLEEHWKKTSDNLHTASIQSNGTRFTKDYLEILKSDLQSVKKLRLSFSIDPPKKVHDLLRDNSFDQVTKHFQLALEMGFKVSILSVVSKETMKHLPEFFDWMATYYRMHKEQGNPHKIKIKLATGKQSIDGNEMEVLGKYLVEKEMLSMVQIFTPGCCIQRGNECFWLELGIDGACYSCNKAFFNEQIFANWKKDSFNIIINKRKMLYYNFKMHQDCAECEYEFFCNSGCPIDRHKTGDLAGKAHECILLKTIMAEVEKRNIHFSSILNNIV